MKKLEKLLFRAVSANDMEQVTFLVKEKGANVNATATQAKVTPLMVAVRDNFTPMVNLLLELGADIEFEDFIRRDAMRYAFKYNSQNALISLLKGVE